MGTKNNEGIIANPQECDHSTVAVPFADSLNKFYMCGLDKLIVLWVDKIGK